jgi:DNA-nicking Smr family endonuclease
VKRCGDRAGQGESAGPEATEPEPEPDPVEIAIGDALDLHRFAPRDILRVVEAYLEAAAERGFAEVRLIHGKGTGVQRARVQHWLAGSPWVIDFRDGPPERGSWGATLVRLRSPGCARR